MIGCFDNSSGPVAEPEFVTSWGESGSAPGELHQPIGIAVASDATVFVADTGNDRIEVFDSDGKFLRAFGSRGEEPGAFRRSMDVDIDAQGGASTSQNTVASDAEHRRGVVCEDRLITRIG